MTVAEFIIELQKLDQNKIIIVQKDAEGNDYSPLEGCDEDNIYKANSTWSSDVFSIEWSAEEACMEEEEWEEFKNEMPGCVVLWPVN